MLPDLYASHPALVWLGLAAALLAVEILSGSGWLLWASASAAVVALAAAVVGDLSPTVALAVFAVLTIASTLLVRRYLPRSAETAPGGDINDNTARMIGQTGRAVGDFQQGAGRVFVDGKEWAAELDGASTLAAGAAVVVTGVAGARLTVRPN